MRETSWPAEQKVTCSAPVFKASKLQSNIVEVRMAEWSKAPDSRYETLPASSGRAFWSTNVGVGSNPTSDNSFASFRDVCHTFVDDSRPSLVTRRRQLIFCEYPYPYSIQLTMTLISRVRMLIFPDMMTELFNLLVNALLSICYFVMVI